LAEKSITPETATLGQRIREARGAESQAAFAKAIGVSSRSLGYYESDERLPDANTIMHICAESGRDVGWLLYGEEIEKLKSKSTSNEGGVEAELLALRKENSEINKELRRLLHDYNDVRSKLYEKQVDPVRDLVVPVVGLAECSMKGWGIQENTSMHSDAPLDIVQSKGFAVVAVGDSMIPAGIEPGFVLFCNPSIEAKPGMIVFFENKDGQATVKFYRGESVINGGQKAIVLQGWLPEPEDGSNGQKQYTDQIAASKVKRIVPVAYIKRL
jgi:SOS-response transcriptional repressor LexA